jgi:hypothetical protein
METVGKSQSQNLPEEAGKLVESIVPENAAVTGSGRLVVGMFLGTAVLLVCVAIGEFVIRMLR